MDQYANCRLCGTEFLKDEQDQLYCCEECETTDKKIDEAEVRREEKEKEWDDIRRTFRGKKRRG